MKIELATARDRDELLDFLYAVFTRNRPDHPRFEVLFPDIFLPTDEAMCRHAVIRENGRIAACVGAYVMTLQAAGCRIPLGGIGQVSTGAESLGKGYMGALLRFQLDRLRDEDRVALVWLGGRLDRYSRYGFEACAPVLNHGIDRRAADKVAPRLHVASVPASEPGSVTPEMWAMRNAEVDSVIEPLERYRSRFARRPLEIWTASDAPSAPVSAWALVDAASGCIDEWCGDPEARLEIALAVARAKGSAERSETYRQTSISALLRPHCAWVGVRLSLLSVLSRERLLEAYRPLIPENAPLPDPSLGPGALARAFFGPELVDFRLPFSLPNPFHL